MRHRALFITTACITAACVASVIIIARPAFEWWEVPIWSLSAYAGLIVPYCRRRQRRRRYVPDNSWLVESASWPVPWSHHDLDGAGKLEDVALMIPDLFTATRPGMFRLRDRPLDSQKEEASERDQSEGR